MEGSYSKSNKKSPNDYLSQSEKTSENNCFKSVLKCLISTLILNREIQNKLEVVIGCKFYEEQEPTERRIKN